MIKTHALYYFKDFLEKNPNLAICRNCKICKLEKYKIKNIEFYFCIELDKKNIDKSISCTKSYYVFPDSLVLIPYGGSTKPEKKESVVYR